MRPRRSLFPRGARGTILRALLERNRVAGVFAESVGTELSLTDLVVRDTLSHERDLERACAASACEGLEMGDGLAAYCGAHAELTRLRIQDNARCGLQIAFSGVVDPAGQWVVCDSGGSVDLHEGVVASNAIGANIQNEDFDIDRLTDGVVFRDNGLDLDMSELPVPDAATGLPSP